jgi:hypothetical protein
MSKRRYTDEEVTAIFERAVEAQRAARRRLASGEGPTLAELQEIGSEVGLPPELVAQAARSLERAGRPTSRRYLGLTIGVGETLELERQLSDREWERLVVDLRETFDARGSVKYDGPFRQWTNGNLQALVEPTESGHRVRLQTVKGAARGFMTAGLASLGGAAAMVIAVAVGSGDSSSLVGAAFLSAMGLGVFAMGALRLPGWARLRRRQMGDVLKRLALAAQSPAEDAVNADES